MNRDRAAAVAALVLGLSLPSIGIAQTGPKLSKGERQALEALVAAVDHAAAGKATAVDEARWQHHVLRVSDGAHYVALRAHVPGAPAPAGKVATYVRLASRRRPSETTAPERSAVREWLAGLRGDPLPMQPGRVTTVPVGEMPIGGAAASRRRSAEDVDATSALRLLTLNQERAAKNAADREAQRLAALEGGSRLRSETLPFEDFEFATAPKAAADGLEIQRGLTAGPGEFDVYIAWIPLAGRAASPRVVKYSLTLPAATTAFAVSDIIVAERAEPLTRPFGSAEQGAHPYAIGALDVTPAPGNVLPADGTLGLVYQVINPSGSASGKPDVSVSVDIARMVGDRLTSFGSLLPQHYDERALPADFDTSKGHPLFGAVRAPLTTFPRGRYRVTLTAVDQRTGQRASGETFFTVRGTAESLLREAPSAARGFGRDQAIGREARVALARHLLTPPHAPSLVQAVDALVAGRYADVIRPGTYPQEDRGRMIAVLAVGLFALGDSPHAVLAQLSQAKAQGAPRAVVEYVAGAVAATAGDDRGAVTAWLTAREHGIEERVVAPLLIDGYLRLRDTARASELAASVAEAPPNDPELCRAVAVAYIASHRYAEAVRALDAIPDEARSQDTDFLVLHALYGGFVEHHREFTAAPARQRLTAAGQRYVENGGRHADLVREWLPLIATGRE